MAKDKLRGKDLQGIGFPEGKVISITLDLLQQHYKRLSKADQLDMLSDLIEHKTKYQDDPALGRIVRELDSKGPKEQLAEIALRPDEPAYAIYGKEHIELGAIRQMETAMRLPVAVAGALMPDAHQGYGLPIGGVLATENAVIPYGVGVDIGCRMCLTVYDLPVSMLDRNTQQLKQYLTHNTVFGAGNGFDKPMDDPVLERPEFKHIKTVRSLKDKAWQQIGSSGSGNHFVEFGVVEVQQPDPHLGLPPGQYLAILSHSGSRGLGATIAGHYTRLAMDTCPLPATARHLAWLDLDSEAGQEYWQAMNLAGDYASACHHQIHKRLGKALGEKPLVMVENHHNFAWKERLADGREVIVHRKGATPAGKGMLGIIPGSMTSPGFIVRGSGVSEAINSASHGAGRRMSRRQALDTISPREVREHLKAHRIELLGGGIDEAPMAYKDIHAVMQSQQDLVEVLGTFTPRVVRMDK